MKFNIVKRKAISTEKMILASHKTWKAWPHPHHSGARLGSSNRQNTGL